MSVERALMNRFALPQASAGWEQTIARYWAILARVPLSRWQFLVRLLLVISLTSTLARLLWLVLPVPAIPSAAIAIPSVVNHSAADGQAINIAELKSIAVFGKEAPVVKQDAPPPIIENQAVDTHLNLVLMGVVSSSDDKLARAIIASGEKQDVYAIGDTLPVGNGVTLSKVLVDRVIINNNNQYESLWLYQADPNATPISQVYQKPPAAAVAAPYTTGPQPDLDRGANAPERVVGSDAVMAEASRSLSDVVAMSIYREGGQVVGYKIRPGRDGEKFKALGLQTDDIVTAVNGMPLTNPAKIMEVYKNMGNTTSASLEIKRGGNVMTVDVVLH